MIKVILIVSGIIFGLIAILDIFLILNFRTEEEISIEMDKEAIEKLIEKLNENPEKNKEVIKELFKILEKKQ